MPKLDIIKTGGRNGPSDRLVGGRLNTTLRSNASARAPFEYDASIKLTFQKRWCTCALAYKKTLHDLSFLEKYHQIPRFNIG